MQASHFEEKKRRILETLEVPDELYTDASPKGSVDQGIRELVDQINSQSGIVTTSSCAGRIAIYLEGTARGDDNTERSSSSVQKSAGGKGGGRWLFVSHDPIDIAKLCADNGLLRSLSLDISHDPTDRVHTAAYVHLKFEPMILHILCSSLPDARKVLGAALSAGFRESGIGSITEEGDMVMVGIRTNGLAFDSIIARSADAEGRLEMLVSEEYVRLLLEVGNARFKTNEQRKARFTEHLLCALEGPAGVAPNWEPAEVRRARKRAEGLARRELLQAKSEAGAHLVLPHYDVAAGLEHFDNE